MELYGYFDTHAYKKYSSEISRNHDLCTGRMLRIRVPGPWRGSMLIGQSHRAGKRAYLVVPAIALCALTALTSCSSPSSSDGSGSSANTTALTIPGPTGPLETHTITVEAVPTADEAGLYIAKDLGYFA